MDERTITSFVSVLLAMIGLAVLAVLVSKNAQTGDVLGSIGSAVTKMICVATSPITGATCGQSASITIPTITRPTTPPRGTSDSTITYGDVVG